MADEIRFILFFDDYSKQRIDVNQLNAKASDVYILYKLEELSENILNGYSRKLVLLEGALSQPGIEQNLKLYKAVYDLEVFYVGHMNPTDRWIQKIAFCFECDLESIDYQLLRSVAVKELDVSDSMKANRSSIALDLAKSILADSSFLIGSSVNEQLSTVKMIAENLLADEQQLIELQKKLEQEHDLCISTQQAVDGLLQEKQKYVRGYAKLLQRIVEQNKKMREFEILFKDNIYAKVDAGQYPNHPIILYLKEHTPLVNLDKLLEVLFYTFQLQDRKSVQVLRLFDSSGERRISALPEYYNVIRSGDKYVQSDVAADFICKFGDYRSALDIILSNRSNLDVLIIVDHKDANDTVVSGANVFWNLCTTEQEALGLGLSVENTIFNADRDVVENSKHAWLFSNVTGMPKDDEFIYLSNLPAVREVIQIVRLYYEAI